MGIQPQSEYKQFQFFSVLVVERKLQNINNMEFNEKRKEALEGRIKKLENLISDKGICVKQVKKARKTQRKMDLAVFMVSLITIAGITVWALSSGSDE